MRDFIRPFRFSVWCFLLLVVTAGNIELTAQVAPRSAPTRPPSPEELSQAELLEAYRNLRDQLRATQTAIVNNRFEAEANARSQAAAIAEKIEAMNATLATERKNRQAEQDRFDFERERQQAELRRSNNSVVWVATAFGSAGLLAMLFAAIFQWRAINRVAEVIDQRQMLPPASEYTLLPNSAALTTGQPVANSTQRLMSAIDRMEQRIKELEHTTVQPSSAAPFTNPGPGSAAPMDPPSQSQAVSA